MWKKSSFFMRKCSILTISIFLKQKCKEKYQLKTDIQYTLNQKRALYRSPFKNNLFKYMSRKCNLNFQNLCHTWMMFINFNFRACLIVAVSFEPYF